LAGEHFNQLEAELRDAEAKRETTFQQQRLLMRLNQTAKFAYLRNDVDTAVKVRGPTIALVRDAVLFVDLMGCTARHRRPIAGRHLPWHDNVGTVV
jgi:hypothetical protein